MRRLFTPVLTLTLVSAVAVAAPAQDSLRVRSGFRLPERSFTYSFGPDDFRIDMRRGRLGITVDLRPDVSRDTVGARVSGVTPGGPADRAGVQTGDVITRFNGTRLAVAGAADDADDDRSRPGMRLINLASRIEKDDTVRLDLRRENRNVTVSFPAGESDMDQIVERMRMPGNGSMSFFREFGGPEAQGGPRTGGMPGGQMRVVVGSNMLHDMELIRVTPQLAQALGISEGVLVADAGRDTTLGLRTGDVITTIGGRQPTSPAHAMRILSSYDTGEAVQFDVMRQRRRISVTGRIPQRAVGEWRVRPNNFQYSLPRGFAQPEMEPLREMQEMHEMMEMPRLHLRDLPRMESFPRGELRRSLPRGEIEHDAAPRSMIRLDGKV